MTAVYKRTTTRPSVNDLFWFHPIDLFPEQPIGLCYTLQSSNWLTQMGVGIQGYSYQEHITWTEVRTRKAELRSDVRAFLEDTAFKSTLNALDGTFNDLPINAETIAEYPDSTSLLDFLCAEYNDIGPNYNPFSTTMTELFTFDTWAHLQASYETNLAGFEAFLSAAHGHSIIFNNTVLEQFYENDVLKTDYTGGLPTTVV